MPNRRGISTGVVKNHMAGKGFGDFSAPQEPNEEEKEGLSPQLLADDAEETSDVSASLFKEISSEEEMEEVASGTGDLMTMDDEGLVTNEAGSGNMEGDISGEDESLFEEIDAEDESQYAEVGGVQESAYGETSGGTGGAGYVSYELEREDVPFIRAGRRDLDGPFDVGALPALDPRRGDEGVLLDNFGSKIGSIFENVRAKEEASPLAGICRDYGTSSGEEGGDDGAALSMANRNLEDDQDSTQALEMKSPKQVQDTEVIRSAAAISGRGKVSMPPEVAREEKEVVALPRGDDVSDGRAIDGGTRGEMVVCNSSEGRRKRGRASRELGALLMDAKSGGRGKRAFEPQGANDELLGQSSIGRIVEACATSDTIGPCTEVRMTRSKASGRQASKNQKLSAKISEERGSSDVTAKRTGKRSAARGGRLGWGNPHESSSLYAGGCPRVEDVLLPNAGTGEGLGVAEESLQLVQVAEEMRRVRGKADSRVKATHSGGKSMCSEGVILDSEEHDLNESLTSRLAITHPQEPDASETEICNEGHSHMPSSGKCGIQDSACNLDVQEIRMVEAGRVVENSSGGRRRSNRQKMKSHGQEGDIFIYNRQRQDNVHGLKEFPINGDKIPRDISNGNTPGELGIRKREPLIGSEDGGDEEIGVDGKDVGKNSSLDMQGAGRKSAKGKCVGKRVSHGRVRKSTPLSKRSLGNKAGSVGAMGDPQLGAGLDTAAKSNGDDASKNVYGKLIEEECPGADQKCDNYTQNTQERKVVCLDSLKECSPFEASGVMMTGDVHEKSPNSNVLGIADDFHPVTSDKAEVHARGGDHCNLEGANEDPLSGKFEKCSSSLYANAEQVSKAAVKSEKDSTLQSNNQNVVPSGRRDCKDDAGSATSYDNAGKEEVHNVSQSMELIDSEALPSVKCGGVAEVRGTEAAENGISKESSGKGRGRPRKLRGTQHQDSRDTGLKCRGRGKKSQNTKKNIGEDVKQRLPEEKRVLGESTEPALGNRRGKRKSIVETAMNGKTEASEEMTSLGTSKFPGMVDLLEPIVPAQVGGISRKELKGKQKGKAELKVAHVKVARKRRKTGKLTEVWTNGDSSSAAITLTGNCESPPEESPVIVSKASQQSKGVQKKGKKILTEVKAVEVTSSGVKGQKAKRESVLTARTKGATIKTLSSIKDPANDTVVPSLKDELIKPESDAYQAKVLGGSPVQLPQRSGEGSVGAENEEVGRVNASLNLESTGVGAEACLRKLDCVDEPQALRSIKDVDSGAVGEDVSSGVTEGDDNKESETRLGVGGSEAGAPRKSWVLCDDCNKWRCIPVDLADQIESTNARWSCRDNPNMEYSDCSIPQEKSNAEINAELQISEVSVCEEGDDKDGVDSKLLDSGVSSGDNKPAVWKLIRRNIFQHRRRKVLEIDEMMVCQCTPPEKGGVGCGENCLNRMLSIECVPEQCPCGETCSNQQFQKRSYAPVTTFRCGKKGFGLRVTDNTPKGTFLIEYVGEVLDVGAFEARQQEYACKGQKHFYFMTLSSNEVIDACSKGNFGRFINHSCEPNCRTEKWMVNGEVCIGLFAIRDIVKGEEVTFDYNYVRVCGAAAKKCECGSSQCRGFIGGDPVTPKAVVESDSDDEDPEPIMLEISDEDDDSVDENKLQPSKKLKADVGFRETTSTSMRTSGVKRKLAAFKEKSSTAVKRVKTTNSLKKTGVLNYKGLTLDVTGGRHDGARTLYFSDVQEKLDDLLDKNGGLRRKKEAAQKYLTLLVLTFASGDSKKDATACSVRDLSLLLEALLRTTSRSVLSDIMNKNGLRMFHNLIKQFRRQWDKTPILRKLIKVLELLASERVLTTDLIFCGPPCKGMESFSESLFELTRHKDTEVGQMARRFRNRWMPPRSQLQDQQNKGPEKLTHLSSIQSTSPVQQTQHSDQIQLESNQLCSPQHQKQSLTALSLTGLDASKPLGFPSMVSGTEEGPHSSDNHNAPQVMGELMVSKNCDGDVAKSNPAIPDEFAIAKLDQGSSTTRKRVSRWDAPAKVEKGTYEPIVAISQAVVPVVDSCSSGRDICAIPAAQVQAGIAQFQFPGVRQFNNKKNRPFSQKHQNCNQGRPFHHEATLPSKLAQLPVQDMSGLSSGQPPIVQQQHPRQSAPPGQPSTWPSSGATGIQEPARLPCGVTTGQPQIHSNCVSLPPQGGPGPGFSGPPAQSLGTMLPSHLSGPFQRQGNGASMIMSSGLPPPHAGPPQIPPVNGAPFQVTPLPGRVFPVCPPLQMNLRAVPGQVLHGTLQVPIGAPPMPVGFPQGPRAPVMASTAQYVQLRPPPGVPHFAGAPFDIDERQSLQASWPSKTGSYEDRLQRAPAFGNLLAAKGKVMADNVAAGGDVEPEPPVPGLSPPPLTAQLNHAGSSSHRCTESTNACQRELYQEHELPPNYIHIRGCGENGSQPEGPGMNHLPRCQMRDRAYGLENCRAEDSDNRDIGSGFLEEHWETPESQGFKEHVFSLVRSRVYEYQIRNRDVDRFISKMADVIVRKEVGKYIEHKNQGSEKIIVRSKLIEKLESYVDNQMELYLQKYQDRNYRG